MYGLWDFLIQLELGRYKAKNSLTKSAMSLCRLGLLYNTNKLTVYACCPLDLTCASSYQGALGSE